MPHMPNRLVHHLSKGAKDTRNRRSPADFPFLILNGQKSRPFGED
jgi:hypothetical protein